MKLILAIAFTAVFSAHAATLFVSKNGSDLNPGGYEAPFLTIQKAANLSRAGDTIRVLPGVYSEDLKLYSAGTSNSTITLEGHSSATIRSLMMFGPWTTIQNFTISGKTNQALIMMGKNADFCVLSNNVVDGLYSPGMNLMTWGGPDGKPFGDTGSDNLIVSNVFQHAMGSLALGVFGDRNVFRGNQLIDSDSVDWIRLFGRDSKFVGNVCSNDTFSGKSGNHPDFFQVFGTQGFGSRGHLIESNIVVGIEEAGQLCMMSADNVADITDFTFRNNIFVGVAAKGTIGVRNVKWHNNLFYRCSTNSFTAGAVLIFTVITNKSWPNFEINAAHDCEVLNNVFLDCGTTSTNASIGPYAFVTNLVNVRADYNFVAKQGKYAIASDPLNRMVGDPEGWNPYRWWEDHGINGGDPLFFDPANLDFRFAEGSPLTGMALPLNYLFQTDMHGVVRGQKWDIGPQEYNCNYSGNL